MRQSGKFFNYMIMRRTGRGKQITLIMSERGGKCQKGISYERECKGEKKRIIVNL